MDNENQGSERLYRGDWIKRLKEEITPTDKFITLIAFIIVIARIGGCEYP